VEIGLEVKKRGGKKKKRGKGGKESADFFSLEEKEGGRRKGKKRGGGIVPPQKTPSNPCRVCMRGQRKKKRGEKGQPMSVGGSVIEQIAHSLNE